jgi:ABC-2 type transport system permease protein
MTGLVATSSLVRLALRRDRVLLPVWLAVFLAFAASSAAGTIGLYPDDGSWVAAAEQWNHNRSLVALYGRVYDTSSIGSLALVKPLGTMAAILAAFVVVLTVRHTRADEEQGRLELLGATVVGRFAPLTAALVVSVGASLALGVLGAVAMQVSGLPADGSVAFGLAWASVGIAFAAITAVVAQLARSARSATGAGIAVLGAAYVVRAVGDTVDVTGPRWLSWLSPIGWAQQFRPYAGNRWEMLAVVVGFAAACGAVAYVLSARRDLGAGLLPDRPGPIAASPALRGGFGLAWRLQRGLLVAWSLWFVLFGLVFGNLASSIGDFLDSPQFRDVIAALGGEQALVDAYIAATMAMLGVIASAYGVQAAMRLRSEESSGHAEVVLATATSRVRWASGHVVIAALGTTALMGLAGLTAGWAHGAQVGDPGQIGRVLGAALVQVPATWVLTGIVVAAFGLVPRLVLAGWTALVGFVLLAELGPLLELDARILDLSPYAHVPQLPGAAFDASPILSLTAAAAVLAAAGLAGLGHRDLKSTA